MDDWRDGLRTIEWDSGEVVIVDQTKLPNEVVFVRMTTCDEMATAIAEMKVRGAPLIGVSAAYGLALTAVHSETTQKEELVKELEACAEMLRKTRPTAVNLFWGIDRILTKARAVDGDTQELTTAVVQEAVRMADEDVAVNRQMGSYGATLIDDGDVILTHCNAGSLATVDYGTALGVVRAAWEQEKRIKVLAAETRPRLQGARLTAYELQRDGIPVTLITDTMVGYVMSRGGVNKVVVGADRIVQDAVINKIGTFNVAVLAKEHDIPFYVAAPVSTLDLSRTSNDIQIEERVHEEVTCVNGVRITPEGVAVMNPAFDFTPMRYIRAIITEKGVFTPNNLLSSLETSAT